MSPKGKNIVRILKNQRKTQIKNYGKADDIPEHLKFYIT